MKFLLKVYKELVVGGLTAQGGGTVGEVPGEGFNSENHNYSFFKVVEYILGSNTILKFSVA